MWVARTPRTSPRAITRRTSAPVSVAVVRLPGELVASQTSTAGDRARGQAPGSRGPPPAPRGRPGPGPGARRGAAAPPGSPGWPTGAGSGEVSDGSASQVLEVALAGGELGDDGGVGGGVLGDRLDRRGRRPGRRRRRPRAAPGRGACRSSRPARSGAPGCGRRSTSRWWVCPPTMTSTRPRSAQLTPRSWWTPAWLSSTTTSAPSRLRSAVASRRTALTRPRSESPRSSYCG